jgi:hypothetical protein
MDWLTTPLATVLAAALVAFGGMLGVFFRGSFDLHMAKQQLIAQLNDSRKQLDFQRDLALKQLETQRQLARDQQAEDRAQRLLSERRTRYEALVSCAFVLRDDFIILQTSSGPKAWAAMQTRFVQRVADFEHHALTLHLIAPDAVLSRASQVWDLCHIDGQRIESKEQASNLSAAVEALRWACREDLQPSS